MCGIAGFVGRRGRADPALVERQLRQLDHRGPDSSGVHSSGRGAIGQTRLAVIDLVTGDPPIANEDASIGVALNGEIYNFRQLRAELAGRGHQLATTGDTEVIAHLAEELDAPALARRLDGMFAFAVWDEPRGRLVLGRDRLGKKPLYYWAGPGRFVFASEIKALLAHPDVPRRLADGAVGAYVGLGYVPSPRTFYDGVVSLPAGHVLVVGPDLVPRIEPYWRPRIPVVDDVPRAELGLEEAAVEVRTGLERAVERRLEADVPLGAFLSGGLDSSAVVALMAARSSGRVRTFTIGFEDAAGYDERDPARLVAERFDTDHTDFVVQPEAVEVVERLAWHFDQPFGDSSALPAFFLCELTRRHVTVALSGDGGDELFAGYWRFLAALAVEPYGRLPRRLRAAAARAVHAAPGRGQAVERARRFLASAELGLPDAYVQWVNFVLPHAYRRQLVGDGGAWAVEDLRCRWSRTEGGATLDRLLELNLTTYLLDDLLPKVDRTSMAHGLEVRSPFLDRELVELALRLPRAARIRGFERKRVLRRAMADLLPSAVLERPKRGFAVPLDRWFRTDLRPYADSMLGSAGARVRAHVSGAALDRVLIEHQRGAAAHGHALWALLMLEVFLRREGW